MVPENTLLAKIGEDRAKQYALLNQRYQTLQEKAETMRKNVTDLGLPNAQIRDVVATSVLAQQVAETVDNTLATTQDVYRAYTRIIREEHVSAEWALRRAVDQIRAVFNRIEDPYFRERRSDVDMIGERILRNLVGMSAPGQDAPRGAVVFAHDLSPADITQLARLGVAGFLTEGGGKTSHSAVLARAFGLPYVVGVQDFVHHIRSGMQAIVDGGRVIPGLVT